MVKRFSLIVFVLLCSVGLTAAQSGRTKQTPTPTPGSITGPIIQKPPPPKRQPTASPTPGQNGDDEVIRVAAALVPIPVSVTDRTGRSVTDLKHADFELRIDGNLTQIAEVLRADTPLRLAMMFDNSSSVLIAREFEKEAAVRFFRRIVRPDRDLAALFSFADYVRLDQPLTRDVSQLIRSIELLPEPKGATALFDGLIEVSDHLRSVTGRRVVVVVSDGEDTYSDPANTLESVIRRLQLNDCQVYVVKTKEFENFKRTGIRGGNANIRSLSAERRMIEIADQTGGAVFSPIDENEMRQAFDRISAELSQQYILSYYPEDDDEKPGQQRTIDVSIKGKSGLTIRARKGYYVPKR